MIIITLLPQILKSIHIYNDARVERKIKYIKYTLAGLWALLNA